MKANELQIGDIVRHINGNVCVVSKVERGKGFACRIGNSEYLWDYNNKYEPIPLTEEILKAIFFVKPHDLEGGEYEYGECRYCYSVGYDEEIIINHWYWDGDNRYLFDYISKGALTINKMKIHYFHELQHALRLCGLNELADNFKLE